MAYLQTQSMIPSANTGLRFYSSNASIASGGTAAFNLENLFGVNSCGLLYIRGNENNLNQSFKTYYWNLAFYNPTSVRYIQLFSQESMVLNNTYGDIYAYLSNYSSSRTTADQTYTGGTAASASDIYLRNAAGAACTGMWSVIRTG